MDNSKKQQSFSRSLNVKSSLPAESNRKSSDLQINKRNSRRRGSKPLSTPRNDQQQQRNSKQQQPAKLRSNVDKRPKPRVTDNGNSASGWSNSSAHDRSSCSSDDYASGSTGLAGQSAGYRRREQNTDYELNSVYAHGSKKQNLNHLLNFHYTPRESEYSVFGRSRHHHQTHNFTSHGHSGGGVRKQRYNKEQFLQANFQFVIHASAKPEITGSPDTLIDWSLIEQINIQTTEEPQCPICLYPPVAAKLTRCGHAYCWHCLLHYLSLSEKPWRKCPICFEAIYAYDLKSCSILQQTAFNLNDEITFELMRRRKGSMYIEHFNELSPVGGDNAPERFPLFCKDDNAKRYSKFLIARRADIAKIIEREHLELIVIDDTRDPEYQFIQQALGMLNERRGKLGEFDERDEEEYEEALTNQKKQEDVKSELPEKTLRVKDDIGAQSFEETTIDEVPDNNSNENYSLVEGGEIGIAADIHAVTGDEASSSPCTSKYYYFYQSNDGQNIYLHPINVKMLQACYGTLDRAPLIISAHILQMEQHSMDEEHRRKFTCLGHLPLTCQFQIVEVDLQPPIVTGNILKLFKEDLQRRTQERQRRDREERKREKKINEINDRQMGKLIASTANINLGSAMEFPTCGFEETLPTLSAEEERPASSSVRFNKSSSYSAVTGAGGVGTASSGAWGRSAPPPSPSARPVTVATVDNNEDLVLPTMLLGDVIAEAMSQRNQQQPCNTSNLSKANGKKQKKSKKMTPIFATGMNYNGN